MGALSARFAFACGATVHPAAVQKPLDSNIAANRRPPQTTLNKQPSTNSNLVGGAGPVLVAKLAEASGLQRAMLLTPACYVVSGLLFLAAERAIEAQAAAERAAREAAAAELGVGEPHGA